MAEIDYTLYLGDCLEIMPQILDSSIDAIFADPPYPYIKRAYGYWAEETWLPMMQEVVRQSRRILKPHGSAIFVLQPNSEKAGRIRPWLWKFMTWCCEEWGIIQDSYWWNVVAIPGGMATHHGLMRSSLKFCLWLGSPDCYRNQEAVLWDEAFSSKARYATVRANNETRKNGPSGHSYALMTMGDAAERRGGVTPFNVLPIANTDSQNSAGANGHGAGTPLKLVDWWLRYITKPGNIVLDMFNGSGTTGLAALELGRKYIGIEKESDYLEITRKRLDQVSQERRGEI